MHKGDNLFLLLTDLQFYCEAVDSCLVGSSEERGAMTSSKLVFYVSNRMVADVLPILYYRSTALNWVSQSHALRDRPAGPVFPGLLDR